LSYLSNIESVYEVLRNAKDLNIKCNLLLGAGCSVSAGIPTAEGIIKEIKSRYPNSYDEVTEKTYANCMKKLSPGERKNLIMNLVNDSKVNIAHIAIAELMKHGYINRVLTPNFDNILIKACGLAGEYPPIYDLASYENFKPEHIPEKCIFYLHGQYTGFKLLNTQKEVEEQAAKLEGLFNRINEDSIWLVIGYSGKNDSLFKLLEKVPVFENRLFWVGYENEEPHYELTEKILGEEKYAFYIKGYNADSFFSELSIKLRLYPPSFILKPFTYLKNIIDTIVPFEYINTVDPMTINLNDLTSNVIQISINAFENDPSYMADYYNKLNLYENIIEMKDHLIDTDKSSILANAYFRIAFNLHSEAYKKSSTEKYDQIIEGYKNCLLLNPSESSAYNNIGLIFQSLSFENEENKASNLYKAMESYNQSIIFSPQFITPHDNWVICIFELTKIIVQNDDLIRKLEELRSLINKDSPVFFSMILNLLIEIEIMTKEAIDPALDMNVFNYFFLLIKESVNKNILSKESNKDLLTG
jgi:NAD-dependent SIR2 family protein deacetylase